MAAWRREKDVDAARYRQKKRYENKTRKVVIVQGSVRICEAIPIN